MFNNIFNYIFNQTPRSHEYHENIQLIIKFIVKNQALIRGLVVKWYHV